MTTINKCTRTCSDGLYGNRDENLCLSCKSNCLLCTTGTDCEKCKDELFYLDDNECLDCESSCKVCKSSKDC